MWATKRKLCSINLLLDALSPCFAPMMANSSSFFDSGSGNTALEYDPVKKIKLFKKFKNSKKKKTKCKTYKNGINN